MTLIIVVYARTMLEHVYFSVRHPVFSEMYTLTFPMVTPQPIFLETLDMPTSR